MPSARSGSDFFQDAEKRGIFAPAPDQIRVRIRYFRKGVILSYALEYRAYLEEFHPFQGKILVHLGGNLS